MLKVYPLGTPVQVLNKLITHIRVHKIEVDPTVPCVYVDCTLHVSAVEETPAFTTIVTLVGADYTAIGFNETQYVIKTAAALHI
jgi:hypothetical protein